MASELNADACEPRPYGMSKLRTVNARCGGTGPVAYPLDERAWEWLLVRQGLTTSRST
jgi:hypothetical protein